MCASEHESTDHHALAIEDVRTRISDVLTNAAAGGTFGHDAAEIIWAIMEHPGITASRVRTAARGHLEDAVRLLTNPEA